MLYYLFQRDNLSVLVRGITEFIKLLNNQQLKSKTLNIDVFGEISLLNADEISLCLREWCQCSQEIGKFYIICYMKIKE